jgi:uncharacterized membrane protein
MTNEEKINLIGQKILLLSNNLEKYNTELLQLKQQLDYLQQGLKTQSIGVPEAVAPSQPIIQVVEEIKKDIVPELKSEIVIEVKMEAPLIKFEEPVIEFQQPIVPPTTQNFQIPPQAITPKPASNFNAEAFIGGKLITIIGIIILVIGLGIGVKYAIENDMLGPLARIVLAYTAGGILLALALKLKEKYKSFSAVLLSGGMASLYFTTFVAFSIYGMFGQLPTFIIMLLFTAFTVFAATIYNLEVIGIIGLVGAYAVPMLLSDGTGKIEVMFCYMAIINIGILVLSFKKYWQILNHVAFGFSWLIVGSWYASKHFDETKSMTILSFSFLFFIIFYISNMSYKIIKKEQFGVIDILRLVSNSFIFFGIGYAALNNPTYQDYLGVFTVSNACVHFIFSVIVFKNKLLDRKLFYLLIALVLSFITIAIPVQLEGSWVTLLWSIEAALLFSIGRYKVVRFYEWIGFVMIALAVTSLFQDWSKVYFPYNVYGDYDVYKYWVPFTNIHLLTSLIVIGAMGSVIFVHHKKSLSSEEYSKYSIYRLSEIVLPVLLFIVTYYAFSNEISTFFKARYQQSLIKVPSTEAWAEPGAINEVYNYSILKLKDVVLAMYSLVFFIGISALAIRKLKYNILRWTAFSFNILIALRFIFFGLNELASLRETCFDASTIENYATNSNLIYLRYLSFALFGGVLWLTHLLLKTDTFQKYSIRKIFSGCIIHVFIVVLLSNELVNLNHILHNGNVTNYYSKLKELSAQQIEDMKVFAQENNNIAMRTVYKLGFTAIWGIYSFMLIAYGIFKKNQVIRITAIALFGITLVKLIIFDTWDLSTGYKVIAYMLLGVILLIVAFLYQKFKVFIFGEDSLS